MTGKSKVGAWFGRAADAVSLWSVVPVGAIAVFGAYLSSGVAWIAQWGPFGWLTSGIAIFLVLSLSLAVAARTKLWRVEAKRQARITGDSSPFDPMARVYENKRLYLRDLAPLGRRQVINKAFINCEIIGPGTVVLGLRSSETKPFPSFKNCLTFDVDCIEIGAESLLAVGFPDCDFDGCKFYHMTLLFFERGNDPLHWITKDARQLLLPEEAETSSLALQEGGPTP